MQALLGLLQRPDLVATALVPPGPAHEPVRAFLRQAFAQRTLLQWSALLAPLDIAWAPVRNLHEAINSEHAAARGMRVELPGGQPHLGLPIKFRLEPGAVDGHLDELGQSTAAVLREIGCDDAGIAALREADAV